MRYCLLRLSTLMMGFTVQAMWKQSARVVGVAVRAFWSAGSKGQRAARQRKKGQSSDRKHARQAGKTSGIWARTRTSGGLTDNYLIITVRRSRSTTAREGVISRFRSW